MKLAVMQPYFLPYIGYFQLMASVDSFVALDDVNYINRGWINRNQIATPNGLQWLTIPLVGASQNRLINELDIAPDTGWKKTMVKSVQMAYARAEQAPRTVPWFESVVAAATGNLSSFLAFTLTEVRRELGIAATIIPTSSIYPKDGLRGQDRILDICRRAGATTYVNASGGRELYDAPSFAAHNIELQFMQTHVDAELRHGGAEGTSPSILDLMMHNSTDVLRRATTQGIPAAP